MKLTTDCNEPVHPIILNNMQNEHWCFTKKGNFVHAFNGIDGKLYYNIIPYEEWPPFVWELYEKEGITLEGPTPIEEIRYPVKNSE